MRRTPKLLLALAVLPALAAPPATAAATNTSRGADAAPAPASSPPAPTDRELRNLEAFARLYGWVRWFHPSDEASAADWDRVAVLGVERVRGAGDDRALRAALESIFLPLAPSMRLWRDGETPAPPPPPPPAGATSTIAWQHLGLGQESGAGGGVYASARLHRPHRVPGAAPFGTITQSLPAEPLRGKRVRLRAAVRADVRGVGNQAQLWLRVDRPKGARGFFDNMGDRPILTPQWHTYEIVGDVAADAEKVVFGGFLVGSGSVLVDDVELAVADGDTWRPVAIANPGFEAGEQPTGWRAEAPGYAMTIVHDGAFGGKSALLIRDANAVTEEPLFDGAPALGEAQEGALVPGLHARVPLAVAGDAHQTWPLADADALARLRADLDRLDDTSWSGDDWRVRAADVVILWNVYEHFYPYFDVVAVDWPAQLGIGLRRALTDHDAAAFLTTLKTLVAEVQDGHGNVGNAALRQGMGVPACALAVVEDRVVVVGPDDGGLLHAGDVVESVDGLAATRVLADAVALRSGTPQWRQVSGLWSFGLGPLAQPAQLRVQRDGAPLEVSVPRVARAPQAHHALDPVATLPGKVLYVDLTRVGHDDLPAALAKLTDSTALVLDMRGYPVDAAPEELFAHLTDTAMQSPIWEVPRIVYPDRRRLEWHQDHRWTIDPKPPRFRGKVVVLTDASAISHAETVMGIVEAYHLGTIVGTRTAGTNGNINVVTLPGDDSFVFTGMRVLKHDGSRHHLVGIAPDVESKPTIAGIRAGRDEQLEAALRLLGATGATAPASH